MNKAKHILLIDDNDVDNFIAEHTLKVRNVAELITTKTSAVSALRLLEREAMRVEQFPDYIFLDLNMPVMDGYAFLKEFTKFPEPLKAQCSIIILTSSEDRKDMERAMRNPLVKQFLQKPLTVKTIEELFQ